MSDELKPCPMCGESAGFVRKTSCMETWVAVRCKTCGVETRHKTHEQDAIAAWNRRPTPEQSRGDEAQPGLQKAWDILTAMVVPGNLQGNGCDETAQRNGIILAANAIAAAMDRSARGREG